MLAPSDARDASTSDLIRCQVRTVGEGPQAFPHVIEVRIRAPTVRRPMCTHYGTLAAWCVLKTGSAQRVRVPSG